MRGYDRDEDAYGNITHMVFIEARSPACASRSRARSTPRTPSGVVRGTVERLPLPLYLRETPLTARQSTAARSCRDRFGSRGRRPARGAAPAHGRDQPLHDLYGRHDDRGHDGRSRLGGPDAACARTSRISSSPGREPCDAPARYVSGYYLRTDRQEQDAGHAWAEAYVEGLGWVGFDPANGVCMTDRHVRVAVGADYLEAAPARGAQVGGADEVLAVKVNVAQGRGLIEG